MNANIERTRTYYKSLTPEDLCDCNYCKNYVQQIRAAYPEVADYLASLGVEIEKPLETSPFEPDENGILMYSPDYVVFGTCPDTYRHQIGEVELSFSSSHPDTGIKEDHFVLTLGPIHLKMLLPLEHD
jgi:hypothetical protein